MANKSIMNDLTKLSDRLQKNKSLENLFIQFKNDYHIIPCVGVEIEFYLSNNIDIDEFEHILRHKIKKERGLNQFEIDLPPTTDLITYIKQIYALKQSIINVATQLNGCADFNSKPFTDDYGNAIHFHISFIDNKVSHGNNIKYIENKLFLEHAAKSICQFMLDSFLIFLPNAEDYLRLDERFMAPTHISFGGNNRTTAIRIPDSLPKRLEHRLAAPSTDLYLALLAILKSVMIGIENPAIIKDLPKIYSNAYDTQYELIRLPTNFTTAQKLFNPTFLA